MYKYTNAQIHKCTNTQMHKRTITKMNKFTNAAFLLLDHDGGHLLQVWHSLHHLYNTNTQIHKNARPTQYGQSKYKPIPHTKTILVTCV